MAAVTRLGLHGGPRGLYGDFSGKAASAVQMSGTTGFAWTPSGALDVEATLAGSTGFAWSPTAALDVEATLVGSTGFTWTPSGALSGGLVSAALSGTVSGGLTKAQVVAGGYTVILTLTNDTWVTTPNFKSAVRQAIWEGLDSAQSELLGWNNEVRDSLAPPRDTVVAYSEVARTSDTVVTITLPAIPNYDVTANETITATIPASSLSRGSAIVVVPTFGIRADAEGTGGWGARGWYDPYRTRKDRRDEQRRKDREAIKDLKGVDADIAKLLHKQIDRDARNAEIAELGDLVAASYSKLQAAEAKVYNERVAKAYVRAALQANFSALEAFEREFDAAREEEDFLFLAMILLR